MTVEQPMRDFASFRLEVMRACDEIERAASLTAEQRRQVSAIANGLEKCCQSKGEHIGPEQYGCFCDMAKMLRALLEGPTQEGP